MRINYIVVGRVMSFVSLLLAAFLLLPVLVGLICGEFASLPAFLLPAAILALLGLIGISRLHPEEMRLKTRESFLLVSCAWLLASLAGTLPYLLTGSLNGFADALFESTSAFTTTSATLMTDLESLPHSLLFWRSLSQWIGGMGILIFALSILPALGMSGQKIASAETTAPSSDKLGSSTGSSAKVLYLIYICFTLAATLLLMLGGVSLFDSMIHALGCTATGSLSSYSEGVAHFNSGYVNTVICVFSLLTSVNFALYYNLLKGKWQKFFRDKELRVFLGILAGAVLLIALNLRAGGGYDSFGRALGDSAFHVVSFMSTSGAAVRDYSLWPAFSQILLFLLAFIGTCSASTGSGIKVLRIMTALRFLKVSMYKRLHPRAVYAIKVDGRNLSEEHLYSIFSFILTYICVFFFSALLLSLEGLDLTTLFSAVLACMSNVGLGLGLLSPGGTFAIFSGAGKLYLSFLMLLGRLEIFTVLMLFTPGFWKSGQ